MTTLYIELSILKQGKSEIRKNEKSWAASIHCCQITSSPLVLKSSYHIFKFKSSMSEIELTIFSIDGWPVSFNPIWRQASSLIFRYVYLVVYFIVLIINYCVYNKLFQRDCCLNKRHLSDMSTGKICNKSLYKLTG